MLDKGRNITLAKNTLLVKESVKLVNIWRSCGQNR